MLNKMLKANNITREEYLSYPDRPYIRRIVLLGWLRRTERITAGQRLELQIAHLQKMHGRGRAK